MIAINLNHRTLERNSHKSEKMNYEQISNGFRKAETNITRQFYWDPIGMKEDKQTKDQMFNRKGHQAGWENMDATEERDDIENSQSLVEALPQQKLQALIE